MPWTSTTSLASATSRLPSTPPWLQPTGMPPDASRAISISPVTASGLAIIGLRLNAPTVCSFAGSMMTLVKRCPASQREAARTARRRHAPSPMRGACPW